MKIAFVGDCFAPAPGAVTERVAAFGSRWVRAGHDVAVIAGSLQERVVLRREQHAGIRVVRTSAPPLGLVASEMRDADVVIGGTSSRVWALAAWGASVLLRVPFVLELQESSSWVGPRPDLCVAPNATVARAHGIAASVIGEGVDASGCIVSPRDDALRAELGLDASLVVAGLDAPATRACLDVAETVPAGIHFVVVGDGAATRNARFVPPPRPERRDRLIAAADVVVASSMADVLDVMARGRAVLLAGRGEAAEVVESSGGGWTVAPGDRAALVEAIREAHDDPTGAWARGEVARLHVIEHYDRDRLAEAYLHELERAR